MIKAKKDNVLFFGLSDRNMELLKAGKPIAFNHKEAKLSEDDIVIFNGRTEESMLLDLTQPDEKTEGLDEN